MPLKPPPDQRADDIKFADQFPQYGDRTTAARLMDTSNSGVTRQFDPDHPDKSYFHCGKIALYAAYMMDEAKGDALWRDLSDFVRGLKGDAIERNATEGEVTRAESEFNYLRAKREDGYCSAEELDAARDKLIETLRRYRGPAAERAALKMAR